MNSATREKTIRVNNAAAAGTSDVTSSVIDTAGFEGVKIYTLFGTITSGAVTSVKIQQSTDDSSYADLEGTAITVADDDDNQVTVHDIYRPAERYLKCVIDRATQNAVVDGIVAVLYGARDYPTTDDASTVVSREVHATPAEGTA